MDRALESEPSLRADVVKIGEHAYESVFVPCAGYLYLSNGEIECAALINLPRHDEQLRAVVLAVRGDPFKSGDASITSRSRRWRVNSAGGSEIVSAGRACSLRHEISSRLSGPSSGIFLSRGQDTGLWRAQGCFREFIYGPEADREFALDS
jgi:hypothetical protein